MTASIRLRGVGRTFRATRALADVDRRCHKGTTWGRVLALPLQEVPVNTTDQPSQRTGSKPTIVLVHGAFADADRRC
jgi:hypothetical protein